MDTLKVGIREFRQDLAEYISSRTPVAVTRHGQTVGYFIPTQADLDAEILALKKASSVLDQLIAEKNIDVESVVSEFKTVRADAPKPKK